MKRHFDTRASLEQQNWYIVHNKCYLYIFVKIKRLAITDLQNHSCAVRIQDFRMPERQHYLL